MVAASTRAVSALQQRRGAERERPPEPVVAEARRRAVAQAPRRRPRRSRARGRRAGRHRTRGELPSTPTIEPRDRAAAADPLRRSGAGAVARHERPPPAAPPSRRRSRASIRSIMERIDTEVAAKLSRDELARQLGAVVGEILIEQKIQLNQAEQRDLVTVLLDDMLGLGPARAAARRRERHRHHGQRAEAGLCRAQAASSS